MGSRPGLGDRSVSEPVVDDPLPDVSTTIEVVEVLARAVSLVSCPSSVVNGDESRDHDQEIVGDDKSTAIERFAVDLPTMDNGEEKQTTKECENAFYVDLSTSTRSGDGETLAIEVGVLAQNLILQPNPPHLLFLVSHWPSTKVRCSEI